MRPLVEARDLALTSPTGRRLFDGLKMRLSNERIALVGRNGVGKSTLLHAIASGDHESIVVAGPVALVPQLLGRDGMSHGEARREALAIARASGAQILLLDEPTDDLDEAGVLWLRQWLRRWSSCALVATHDRRLLEDFRHFFVVSESGCRYVHGGLADVDAELARDHVASERRYAARLRRLEDEEQRAVHLERRKARKKRYGRVSEIDRATPRIRLNAKRGQAQVSHGRIAKLREARMDRLRDATLAARRYLDVALTPSLIVPRIASVTTPIIEVHCHELHRVLACDRLGVVGPNGAGKTTLLETLVGKRQPSSGTVWCDSSRIGVVAQGGANWMLEASLVEQLAHVPNVGRWLAAHRFPLALAERPLRSLSPGERARAALLCLLANAPPIEMLVLDEPTFSLDLVGQGALTEALRAWTGGLVVASHDRSFLARIGVDELVELGAERSTTFERRVSEIEVTAGGSR